MTAGVWAGGVALATLTTWARARAGVTARPRGARGLAVAAGLVALVLAGRGGARRRRPGGHRAGGPGPGRGARGVSKEEISPTSVFDAQLAAM